MYSEHNRQSTKLRVFMPLILMETYVFIKFALHQMPRDKLLLVKYHLYPVMVGQGGEGGIKALSTSSTLPL